METLTPLGRAIEIVGSQTALALAIGTFQQNISWWLNNMNGLCPPKWAIPIERATNGQVLRSELCPDVFPLEETTAA
ncbi:MAG: helix-turn-helix domain-containing protein [Pseudomonadales bacterium]|nr:helix-turn-helix domain-containing protein [Pseudomonadales bacterium]